MNPLSLLLRCLLISTPLLALDLRLPPEYAERSMEYSGLDWYGEQLVLLPQYPDGILPAIDKTALKAALHDPETILSIRELPFDDHFVREAISGFEGYEALLFDGDNLYLLVEARTLLGSMNGYLVKCRIDTHGITAEKLIALPMPADISNFSFEALGLDDDGPIAFYEANGIVRQPHAYHVDRDLASVTTVDLEAIPYRLTDTTPFVNNSAWALQTYWNGERDKLKVDESENFGRIIKLVRERSGIRTTGHAFALHRGDDSYNWEGIVTFEERGFIVVTDTHPKTLLRFIEWER